MTLGPLALLSVVGIPLALGAALLRLQGIVPRTDRLAYLGWAWIQGALGVGLGLSAWLWVGAPLRAAWLAPAFLVVAGLTLALARRRVPVLEPRAEGRAFPRWERILFALAVAAMLAALADRILLASGWAVAASDEALIYASKAKVIFHAGDFGAEFRRGLALPGFVQHPDYPPLNPLLQVWVHAHAGEVVHVENRLPIQLFGPALVLVAAAALRRRARPGVAALFLVCIATLNFTEMSMRKAYADLLVAVGALVVWDLWQRHREDGERAWLRLLATSACLLVWSKNEGLLHVVAFGLAAGLPLLLRRRPEGRAALRTLAAWGVPLLASILYLAWFNAHFGVGNDLVASWTSLEAPPELETRGQGLTLERASQRVAPILASFARQVLRDPERSQGLLFLFLLLVLLDPPRAFARARAAFTVGLLIVQLGYLAVYLGTGWEIERHLATSLHRLVFHLLPAQGLWVCLYVAATLPRLASGRVDAPFLRSR
ncbi:MAG TPA: hypothetical protein VF530_02615 [Planctomycetota bacterium]